MRYNSAKIIAETDDVVAAAAKYQISEQPKEIILEQEEQLELHSISDAAGLDENEKNIEDK